MLEKDTSHLVIVGLFAAATIVILLLSIWQLMALRKNSRLILKNAGEEGGWRNLLNWIRTERWYHESSILSIPGNFLRYTDGSFGAAFWIDAGNTIYADLPRVNQIYEKWAELIGRYSKLGYVVQIRDTKHISTGDDFYRHLQNLNREFVHREARSLYLANAAELNRQFAEAEIKQTKQTLWIRVPTRHASDQHKENWRAYWQVFRENLSVSGFFLAWFKMYELKGNKIIRRISATEQRMRKEAEKIFREFELEAPQDLQRLSEKELRKVVYLGHVESATGVPIFLDAQHDLRPYFGKEKISYGEDIIWHGSVPAAIISMSRPPSRETEVGIMRALNSNPTLCFRHTIISDFMPLSDARAQKKLNAAIKRLERQHKLAEGKGKESKKDPHIENNLKRLIKVKKSLGDPGARPLQARVCILVYGLPVKNNNQRDTAKTYLDAACERVINTIRLMPGADGVRETAEHLRVIYPQMLPGELSARELGYEIEAESRDALALAPLDGDFKGCGDGELWVTSVTGEIFPLTLRRPLGTRAPGAYIVAGGGGGKSFLVGTEILCWLNYFRKGRVIAVDYGRSYAWLAKALNGRVFEFSNARDAEVLTFNSWWYPGLEDGLEPDDRQIELVAREIMRLAGISQTDQRRTTARGFIIRLIKRVYDEFVSQNKIEGMEKHEPTLSAFYRVLTAYDTTREGDVIKSLITEMEYALEQWLGNPWIDAPTAQVLKENSRFTIFELSNLDGFGDELKEVLAFRTAAFVMNTEYNRADGEFSATLKIFDEMHENRRRFPMIADAIDILARRERKSMGSLLLASQNFKDLEYIEGVLTNTAIKIAGKQEHPVTEAEEGKVTDFKALINNMNLNQIAQSELKKIVNVDGEFTEFLVKIETGGGAGVVSKFRHRVSPLLYWILTTDPDEINAKEAVEKLTGEFWTYDEMFDYLARKYPYGLDRNVKFDGTELAAVVERFKQPDQFARVDLSQIPMIAAELEEMAEELVEVERLDAAKPVRQLNS